MEDAVEPQQESHEHWQWLVEQFLNSAQERHGGRIRFRTKRDALWLWRPLHWLLRLVTLGQSIDLVDGNYYALLGRTLWLPGDGSSHRDRAPYLWLSILSHEIDHLDWIYFADRDARRKTRAQLTPTSWWFRVRHYIKYWLWPLPFRFARYREQIEAWGHERNLELHLVFNRGKCARWYRKWLVMQLSSATYAWACSESRAFQRVDEMIARLEQAYQDGVFDSFLPPGESNASSDVLPVMSTSGNGEEDAT
jgi:hypothetical protein